ncbi:ERCC4 domain-containing protein [Xylaria sp. FL0043]|nr:ERCC4 domain-containing protein [Xylaria sp. FL0043]
MPAEVIVLSSSPARPSPAPPGPSFETVDRRESRVSRRALGHSYSEQIPAYTEPSQNAAGTFPHITTQPLAGTKRASSDTAENFLFLSDDFDTTGDLDGNFYNNNNKKSRISRGLSHSVKRADGPALPQKTRHAASRSSSHRESLQPVRAERRSNPVEDIEFSSSPINLTSKLNRKAPQLPSDPFASSPRDYTPRSASHHDKEGGRAISNLPAELRADQSAKGDQGTGPCSKMMIIDLSSDPIDSSPRRKPPPNPSNTRLKGTWDPISSSAPETHGIQDSLPYPTDAAGGGSRSASRVMAESGSDSDGLPDLDNFDFSKIRATKHLPNSLYRPVAQASKQITKKVNKSVEERDRERKQKAEAREAAKERKRIEKERMKEQRASQKEKERALAEVNKLRTDKKVSTPEMIVDIPASINSGLKVQIEALLSDLDVEHETWDSTVEHVVKWRRKVTSRFNKEIGLWEPISMRVQDECHVLVVMQAAEFVKLVLGEEGHDLEAHVLRMKSKFPSTKLIYLIEGLTPWMRKNRNLLNRQFASAVRNLVTSADPGPSSNQRRHGNNSQQEYIDEDKVEDALLSLQVLHGTLVHHTNASVETAQWVAVFTQHISTIPYRKARDASATAGFCMESGQVLTGDGAKDTYILMLQTIGRLTPPIAYGIVAKYPSLTDLVRGLEEEGPLALAECKKGANKDGALTDRTIGQAISKRVHKIFLGQDPTSTDV